jgi:hypothetical protein
MKNPISKLRFISLLGLILLAWTAAYAQITPLGDSYTNTADPTTNYGSKTLLDVDGATQITYLQFDLASISATASISQATLKLYVNAVTTAGSFNVDYVNGTWTESTIDASNAPALGTTIASGVSITTADKNQYILINVTPAVQAWLSGSEANNGIALVADGTFNATFDSKENTTTSHPAELDIAYAGGDGTITGVTTASGSGLTGGGSSGTLNLSLTSACAANQVLQWSGTAWKCSSAGTGTITGVTAGTDLTGGGTSGNVTLNLNTTALNSTYAQLGTANTFTGTQTVDNTVAVTGSNGSQMLQVTNTLASGSAAAINAVGDSTGGYAVQATSPRVGVYGIKDKPSALGQTLGVAGGIWGDTADKGYSAVNGTADDGSGAYFANNSPTGYATVAAVANNTSASGAAVSGTSSSTNGYGVEGTGSNIGVFGQGSYGVDGHGTLAGIKGVATASGGLSGLFQGGQVNIAGNNNAALIGDPGCGPGYAGIGLTNNLSGCTNYTLLADTTGDTYVNSTGSASIHFRNNNKGSNSNGDLATIDNSGNMTVAGAVHGSGNASAMATASNYTIASTDDCVLPLTAPNSNCLTPNMTLTVTTSGGPVLVSAIIPGVTVATCPVIANFYLVMDSQFISGQVPDWDATLPTVTMMSLQAPAAGTHTFQVQESDDASMCGSGDYFQTYVSWGEQGSTGWASQTRTLIVREF